MEPVKASWIVGCSPIGLLAAVWYPVRMEFGAGLIVQAAVVIALNIPLRRSREAVSVAGPQT